MKGNILVVSHKNSIFPTDDIYRPIIVGNNQVKNFEKDNSGVNISGKNSNYCELTALYWAWKNTDLDIIGLCHYRRYFNFKGKEEKHIDITFTQMEDYIKINMDEIEKILKNIDIILPKKVETGTTIEKQYRRDHISSDWDILLEVLKEKYPKYYEESKEIFKEQSNYGCNMFISSKKIFNEYMEWLFDILFEVEKRIVISDDSYQKRVFGFMSERLLHLYVNVRKLRIKEYPMVMLHEKIEKKKKANIFARMKKSFKKRIGKNKDEI